MKTLQLCISDVCVKNIRKEDIDYTSINRSITQNSRKLTLNEISTAISDGYSFTPATFGGKKRKKENAEQMQLFVLDFDSDTKSGSDRCSLEYNEALQRASRFHLPVVISYETKSSHDYSRYRLAFLYNVPVYEKRYMELICRLLLCVFPEADPTSSDISKFYLPGKNVVMHSDEYFYLDMLIVAARTVVDTNSNEGWKSRLTSLQSKTGIVVRNTDILIDSKPSKILDLSSMTIYTYMVLEPESSKIDQNDTDNCDNHTGYIYFSDTKEKVRLNSEPTKRSVFYQKNIPCDDCVKRCRLYAEFVNGTRKLEHHEWFGLATNLIYKNRGMTEFRETLEAFPNLYDDIPYKLQQVRYAAINNFFPTRCENYCPYTAECYHKTNAIFTMKKDYNEFRRIASEEQYIELSELREQLNHEMIKAVTGINRHTIIKTQTGAGKTLAALNAIKHSKDRIVMGFANTDLMYEVYNKAITMGIEAVCTPTTDEIYGYLEPQQRSFIEALYKSGTEELVNEYLRELGKNNDHIRAYFKRLDKALKYSGHIFTTHARLLTMGATTLANSTVIVDEDILPLMYQVRSSSVEDLHSFCRILHDAGYNMAADKLRYIISFCKEKSVYFRSGVMNITKTHKRIIAELIADTDIYSCVSGLLESDYFYYNSQDDEVSFIMRHNIDCSYNRCVMLSATAEKDIHTKLFSGCNFVELPQARYQGKLILDHEKSYSRYYFEQAPERLFKELTDRHLDCNFITFKKFTQYLDIDKSRILYFGRAIGVNCFTGKNLVVVGVPHKPEYVYRLTAHALDIECENDTLAIRVTEANGFSFYMMTLKNKEMQKLQQYFLETDLEQAIGRARLLNKNCTVYVYSRYPAKQCVLAEEILDDTGNTVGN